jgi:hypothetical protein
MRSHVTPHNRTCYQRRNMNKPRRSRPVHSLSDVSRGNVRRSPPLLACRPAAALASLLLFPSAFADPRIAITPEELEMGHVKQGGRSETQLTVTNAGDAPLVIQRIVTSCPCATVSPLPTSEAQLAPGESVDLTLRYTADEDPAGGGAAVAIYSNDPATPVLVKDLRLVIDRLVRISPPEGIHWGLAPRGQPLPKELVIAPGDARTDIELLDATTDVPGIRITSEKIERPDARFVRLTFALDADVPVGTLDAALRVHVRVGDEQTRLSIPFRGEVIGDLLVSPPAIVSPKTKREQGQKISEITLGSTTGGSAPAFVGAVVVGPVRALVEPDTGPERHRIGVYVAENAPGGPQSATVFVMTRSEDEPIVAVPVWFYVAPPVLCEPEQLVIRENGSPREIDLHRSGGGAVRIKNVRYETDALRVDVRSSGQQRKGGVTTLSVASATGLTPEKRSTMLVVETDVPGAERLRIPVMVLP